MPMEFSQLTRASLQEFRRDLRQIGPAWPKEVTKVNKTVAEKGAARARAYAMALGSVWARNAPAIRSRATQTFGAVKVQASGSARSTTAGALTAFWGSNRRTGWYANAAHQGPGKRQHPPWVGNTWQPGVRGQGPYAINNAIADLGPELLEDWARAIDDLTRRAFPGR